MRSCQNPEQKPEVAFFVFYTSIFYCGPFRNSARLWMEKGYSVSVFQIADPNNRKHKPLFGSGFVLHEIKGYYLINFFRGGLDRIFRLLDFLGIKKLSNLGGEIGYFLSALYFTAACYLKADKKKKYILIAGDPPGLLAAYLISRIKGSILVYWCLELWIENDLKDYIGQRIFKRIERWANRKALCTVEFGEDRCELLVKENNLARDSMISMPNSPLGEARIERNYYFNEKFGIPKEMKIVMYSGGVGEIYGIEEVLNFVDLWPKGIAFVIHGRIRIREIEERLKLITADKNDKIYLDFDPVEYEELRVLYSSCDIGLQVWRPLNNNLKHPGLSSGKIFHWLQAGVPVIARNLKGYKEFIEGNGIGVCVDDMKQVSKAIEKILNEEPKYRENCIKTIRNFSFEAYHEKLIAKTQKNLV